MRRGEFRRIVHIGTNLVTVLYHVDGLFPHELILPPTRSNDLDPNRFRGVVILITHQTGAGWILIRAWLSHDTKDEVFALC